MDAAKGKWVLVVEDEFFLGEIIKEVLLDVGFRDIVVAPTISDAFERLARGPPELAILDVNVGAEKAFPVAERLKQSMVPLVFCTSTPRATMPAQWMASPHVEKPNILEPLLSAIIGLRL